MDNLESFIYISARNQYMTIEGLVSPPGVERANTKNIFTFVNDRWVKDKILRSAVLRGYHSHLLKGRFPQAILYCTIDPSLVDVNVHPNKTELRFQYVREIQDLIAHTIRKDIRQGAWAAPPDELTSKNQQSNLDLSPPVFAPSFQKRSFQPSAATVSVWLSRALRSLILHCQLL